MSKIMAVVALQKEQVGGGAPIFYADNPDAQQQLAFRLEKILDATAHDLKNGLFLLVEH